MRATGLAVFLLLVSSLAVSQTSGSDRSDVPPSVNAVPSTPLAQPSITKPPQSPSLSANQAVITNQDVESMVKAGISAEIVSAKVKNSTCKCDTSPVALAELKESGVPDNSRHGTGTRTCG